MSSSERVVVSRKFLFEQVREFHPKVSVNSKEFPSALKSTISQLFSVQNGQDFDKKELEKCVNYLDISMKRHWRQSKSVFKSCIANHPEFYNEKIKKSDLFSIKPPLQQPSACSEPPKPSEAFEASETNETNETNETSDPLDLSEPPVKKPFIEKSKSQKNRESLKIRHNFENDAIIHAAIQIFTEKGFHDASFVLKKINKDPACAKRLRKFIISEKKSGK